MLSARLPSSLSTQLVRYAVTGFLNSGLGLGLILGLHGIFGVSLIASNAVGYGFGWVLSYGINRTWTFGHEGRVRSSMLAYFALVLAAFSANIVIIHAAQAAHWSYWIAQIAGTAFYSCSVFFGAKYVIFRHHK